MLQRFSLLIAAAALLVVAGCTDSADPNSSDKKTTLTADTWRTTKFTVGGADMLSFAQTTTKFNSDGTYTATNPGGGTKSGTWVFNVDETNIEMTEGSETVNWEIRTLTSSSLKLRSNMAGTTTEFEAVPD